jgi:hypothetical protein
LPEKPFFSGLSFIYWIILGLVVLGICILQIRFYLIRKSFTGEEV